MIWRPVRVSLDEHGEVEDTERGGEEVTKKGTKRKRAPYTKGPCEHGVKPRSNCKVCSACPHGKWRRLCKECGGAQSASTVVSALSARSAVGLKSASTGVSALGARSAVVHRSASTVVALSQGVRRGINLRAGRQRSKCKECGGSQICEHGRRRSQCKEVAVSNLRARSSALSARSAVGLKSACGRRLSVQGVRWGINLRARRQRYKCKECGHE